MSMTDQKLTQAKAVGHLKDLLSRVDPYTNPFLYYLPQLINNPHLNMINPDHAVKFTELALKHETSPIITDALKILNKIINPEDGSLYTPSPTMFYDNRNFFWHEMGNNKQASDVISHILNRTIFFISTGDIS